MFIKSLKILNKFGVDIKVYNSDLFKPTYDAGIAKKPLLTDLTPDELHEPVLPFSIDTAGVVNYLSGGAITQFDYLWLSTHTYPKNTVVIMNSRPEQQYKVTNITPYSGYSDLIIYQLKGDDTSGKDQGASSPNENTF